MILILKNFNLKDNNQYKKEKIRMNNENYIEKMSKDDYYLDEKRTKKIDKKMQSIFNRVGFDRKTQDEVFDKKTLKTIEKLISDQYISYFDFPISTGKEGNIFRGYDSNKKFIAIKIYRTSTSTFKHISKYLVGDPRFKDINKNKQDIINNWTKKEFINLEKLLIAGIRAPKPITRLNNVLIMEYIGNIKKSAPLMKNIKIENPEIIFLTIINYIKKMYKKVNLVHADLSEYNILIHKKKPYIIDLGQAVLTEHPKSLEFLRRDIKNITNYFKKYNIKSNPNLIFNDIIESKIK